MERSSTGHQSPASPLIVAAVAVSLALPWQAVAAPPATAAASVDAARLKPIDVALTAAGLLHGQVVGGQGAPIDEAAVALFGHDGKPVVAKTNNQGAFAYRGVKPGVYYLAAGESVRLCRVWKPTAAPPSAGRAVLLVADAKTVRGQQGPPPAINGFVSRSKRVFTNPLAVAAIVGTAVAVPVAIANGNQDDDPPSS